MRFGREAPFIRMTARIRLHHVVEGFIKHGSVDGFLLVWMVGVFFRRRPIMTKTAFWSRSVFRGNESDEGALTELRSIFGARSLRAKALQLGVDFG